MNIVLYLIDGPPEVHPRTAQTVVFVSPNDEWFKYIRKNSTRPKLIMPLWTAVELETAAIQLNLKMNALQDDDGDFSIATAGEEKYERGTTLLEEEKACGSAAGLEDVPVAPALVADRVQQRFQLFGGVARACLSTSEQFVKDEQGNIADIIKAFNDGAKPHALLGQEKDHERLYHCICHLVPNEGNVRGGSALGAVFLGPRSLSLC